MSEPSVIIIASAIIASIPPTLMGLAALVQGMRNGEKANKLVEKTAEIHMLANDNLSKMAAALGIANEKIQGLEKAAGAWVAAQARADGVTAGVAQEQSKAKETQ